MLRALFGVAVLLVALPGSAAPLSRWTSQALEGAGSLWVAGRGTSALVVTRQAADPLRSFDGGATWTTFRVANQVPTFITVSPTDALTWYAQVPTGAYRTRDGGNTWTLMGTFQGAGMIAATLRVGADPNLVYAFRYYSDRFYATGAPVMAGMTVSNDGGDTWREFTAPWEQFTLTPSPASAQVLWVQVFEKGAFVLYRSNDGGASWIAVTPPGRFGNPGFVVPDGADARAAYLVRVEAREVSLLSTTDGGATWSEHAMEMWWGDLRPDPLEAGRAYLFDSTGRVLETRNAGRSWALVDGGNAESAGLYRTSILASDTRRVAFDVRNAKIRALDLTDGALALGSDLWWNPAASGAGLTITQHASNRPFVVWYTYDTTGAPVWRVIPGGTWSDRTLTGQMYETTGPVYFGAAFDPDAVSARAVGTATLRFEDQDNGVFSYSVGGVSGENPITRQLFAAPAESFPNFGNLADLWWNPREPGWGIAINHQHNRIFATWYVYGDDGKPLWVVMPDAVIGAEFAGAVVWAKATGDIYTARGPAAGAPFDPAQVVPTRIGTATLRFRDTEQATLEYTAFGRTESRAITRQPF